jgi:hypothetical protein
LELNAARNVLLTEPVAPAGAVLLNIEVEVVVMRRI